MLKQTLTYQPFSGRNDAILRLGGHETLYIKYVERFQSKYSSSAAELHRLINVERYEEASRLAHSVKGLAATLGMQDLQICSEAIESAISEGRFSDLPLLFQYYERALIQILQSDVVQSSSGEGTAFSGLK